MQGDYFSCLPNASGLEASPCVTTQSLIYATDIHNEPFSHDHFGFHKVNQWDEKTVSKPLTAYVFLNVSENAATLKTICCTEHAHCW